MRNSDFSCGKMQQKSFEDIKNELCANPLVQPYGLQKELTVNTAASEKFIGGVLSQKGNPVIYVSRKLTPAEQNYTNIEREALAIVCGHKIEAIRSWKTIYPTDGPQNIQISLCTRQGDPKDSIS